MFYNTSPFRNKASHDPKSADVSAIVSLTPSESKRLIAKAAVKLPEVKQALKKGFVVVGHSSTCGFVAEELLGTKINKRDYMSGCITGGELCATLSDTKMKPIIFRDGKQVDISATEAIKEFTPDDVIFKSGNAVDPDGNVGILVATEMGIGPTSIGAHVRDYHLIVPVGLEKLIPSVLKASLAIPGVFRTKYCTGLPATLLPLIKGQALTEIQAFEILCNINPTHIASGGIGGSEGTVILCLTGNEQKIEEAMSLIKSIKGEPPVPAPPVNTPTSKINYRVTDFHKKVWPKILPIILRVRD
jgi:hypothetical protein